MVNKRCYLYCDGISSTDYLFAVLVSVDGGAADPASPSAGQRDMVCIDCCCDELQGDLRVAGMQKEDDYVSALG